MPAGYTTLRINTLFRTQILGQTETCLPKKPVVTAWVSSLRHIVWCRWQCITIGALWQSCLRRHKAQRLRELFFFLWDPGPNGMNIHESQLFRCEQQGIPIIFHRFTDPTWPNPPASCATGKPSDQWTVTQPPQESAIWPWLKQFRRFQGGTLWDAAVGMLRLALLLLKWRLVIDDVDRWRWTVLTYITIIIIIIFSSKIVHAYLSYFLLYLISFKLIK